MKSPYRVLFLQGPYTAYGRVESYLLEEGRYDLDVYTIDSLDGKPFPWRSRIEKVKDVPHLCLFEWHPRHATIIQIATEELSGMSVQFLAIIPKKYLREYVSLPSSDIKQFIMLPLIKDELKARVALALGARPAPLDEGMIAIDEYLAINFETRVLRKGKNNYSLMSPADMPAFYYMYKRINRWVSREEFVDHGIIDEYGRPEDAMGNRVNRIRKYIEDDPKFPRYLLNNRLGSYMLHSAMYPKGDNIHNFGEVLRQRLKSGVC